MSFVERFVVLCPYLGESTTGGSTVDRISCQGNFQDYACFSIVSSCL